MNVVGIHSLPEDKESLGVKLAAALGVTAYEALSRLRIPGNGPLIVAVLADPQAGDRLVGKLRAGGFHAMLLTADEIAAAAGYPSVRRFGLGDGMLHAESAEGGSFDMSYHDIQLIVRGTRIMLSTSTETVKNRSFSLGRAVVSGGLMLSKTTKSVRETTSQSREGFFIIYGRDGQAFVFNEKGIVYDYLGTALQPASAANFAYLLGELRRRSAGAVYDDRLMKRVVQAALLGPRLSPEAHLAVATCLLAKALRSGV